MNHNRVDQALAHIYLSLIMWLTIVFSIGNGFTRIFKFNKPNLCSHLFYGRTFIFWVIGSNLILRCTWTYRLSAHLCHNYLTLFSITALAIFHHFQWVFFHVENEGNKMNSRSNTPPSINNLTTDADKLLGV
ncbi:hypothetical protein SLA2020_315100 [Shorea laevis]